VSVSLDPIKFARPTSAEWPAQLTSNAIEATILVCQQRWSRASCFAELAVSSPAGVTVVSTHIAYQQRDGQAELA